MPIIIFSTVVNIVCLIIILFKLKDLKVTDYRMEEIRRNTELALNSTNSINYRVCNEPYCKAIDDCINYLKDICKYDKKKITEISNEELIADIIKRYKSYKDSYTKQKIF